MAKKKESKSVEPKDVAFLTSLALAVNDVDGVVRHIQFSIVQEKESKLIRAFMDVVDPSKVKLADVSESHNS